MYFILLLVFILQRTVSLITHFGTTTQWTQFYDRITIYVDYSILKLSSTPRIFTRVSCIDICWAVSGTSSVYQQSKNGFRVYLRLSDPNYNGFYPLSITQAAKMNFTLHYVLFVEEPTNQIAAVVNQTTSTSNIQKEVVDQTARDLNKVAIGIAVSALVVVIIGFAIVIVILSRKNREVGEVPTPRGDAERAERRYRQDPPGL